jgi:peptidoglycan hydrolase-like protein with peptidoglycan-binding domain
MPDIKDTVGDGGTNQVHDVALVQAMLRVVKDAKNQPYLAGNYDGSYGLQTRAAIERFQADHKLAAAAAKDAPAAKEVPVIKGAKAPAAQGPLKVGPGDATLLKLEALLPAGLKDMRIIEKTRTVYLPATEADAKAALLTITSEPNLDANFRARAQQAAAKVFQELKIAISVVPKTGGRRDFAAQAAIPPAKTQVGPGESNHNFGRAADFGFTGFRWLKGDGTLVADTIFLDNLEKKAVKYANEIWSARDVHVKAAGLFVLKESAKFRDRPHVQTFDQNAVVMGKALVTLLNAVATMKWGYLGGGPPRQYSSNLGLGALQLKVGTAREIWGESAVVKEDDLVKAVNDSKIALDDARLIWAGKAVVKKSEFKPITAKSITKDDLTAVRKALKSDFATADRKFDQWKP